MTDQTAFADGPVDEHASKYPTLTSGERSTVADLNRGLAEVTAQITVLQEQAADLRARRTAIFKQAALRDVTPEQVSLTYRTTGQGRDDLTAIVRDMHPYLVDFGVYRAGDWTPDARLVLGAGLHLTGDRNDPDQVEAVAEALLRFAALCAPDGGLAFDTEKAPFHEVDWTWVQHAQGMHPVDIVEDDLGETRSFLLAHTADGSRAVLMDSAHRWVHRGNGLPDGIAAQGTLIDVLTETFRIARDEKPGRDEEF